ncbi:hypothetical protein EV189_1428 [Motilibacter rhizosphaerae]|uniref:Uncharacterized protein n=1 Tax=Motilibacter rhizosphaerae TaxID=598652 RepID=A0A4Q7NRG8_9ACTN|nr:hypothetical protein [Motilibacter rhizosphaerae]RZS89657.1 hypothetical protein EV189_1428 [Motilibacter rhizosphaerae]
MSSSTAAAARTGRACFGGTTARDITIRVRAQLYTSSAYPRPTTALRAWASPSLPTVGTAKATDHGAIPVQDSEPCRP